MELQRKSAPAGGGTPVAPGLAARKERLMTHRISEQSNHRDIARIYLELSREDLENVKRNRDNYIHLAKKYGLSNVEIGEAVGLSEARVRAILRGDV